MKTFKTPKNQLEKKLARKMFAYKDGILYWRVRTSNRIDVGDKAGSITNGRLYVGVNGKSIAVHNIVWR